MKAPYIGSNLDMHVSVPVMTFKIIEILIEESNSPADVGLQPTFSLYKCRQADMLKYCMIEIHFISCNIKCVL